MSGPLLPVPVHLQDDLDSCGLACAQMALCYLTGVLYQQTDLAPQTIDPGWATSPDQLCAMINARLDDGAPPYSVFAETVARTAMDRVAAALGQQYPAVVLTDASGHWVVVHGLTQGKSGALTIHLRNSEPDRVEAGIAVPLPLHDPLDQCLSKDIVNSGQTGGEVAACRRWNRSYMARATVQPVKDKFVVVAPAFPIPKGGLYNCGSVTAPRPIVDSSTLGDLAWSRLVDTGLLLQPEWSRLGETGPQLAGSMHLRVQDLDSGEGYFLVFVENSSGGRVLIQVSETTGEFLGALLQPSARLVSGVFSGAWGGGDSASGDRFVWRYSRATLFSPFVPLVRLTDDGTTRYIRPFDGKRFDDIY